MCAFRLIAGLAIVIVSLAVAQENTRHVEGSVVDADTGQPIEGARLQLFGATRAPLLFTDKDGLFAAAIPSDSGTMINASASGYIADFSRVPRGCSPCDVTFRLRAKAVFSGRVVASDDSQPVMHVQVAAFPFSSGELSTLAKGRALTDSAGVFSLELPAGQYFLRFTPSDAVASLNIGDKEDTQSRRFLPAWWPGGDDWKQASPAVLTGGSAIRLPDIPLSSDAGFTVSGTLLPQYCHDEESFKVTILRTVNGSQKMLRSAVARCGAEYAFLDLTPGTYEIAMDGTSGQATARIDFQVKNENVHADLPTIPHPAASNQP